MLETKRELGAGAGVVSELEIGEWAKGPGDVKPSGLQGLMPKRGQQPCLGVCKITETQC